MQQTTSRSGNFITLGSTVLNAVFGLEFDLNEIVAVLGLLVMVLSNLSRMLVEAEGAVLKAKILWAAVRSNKVEADPTEGDDDHNPEPPL